MVKTIAVKRALKRVVGRYKASGPIFEVDISGYDYMTDFIRVSLPTDEDEIWKAINAVSNDGQFDWQVVNIEYLIGRPKNFKIQDPFALNEIAKVLDGTDDPKMMLQAATEITKNFYGNTGKDEMLEMISILEDSSYSIGNAKDIANEIFSLFSHEYLADYLIGYPTTTDLVDLYSRWGYELEYSSDIAAVRSRAYEIAIEYMEKKTVLKMLMDTMEPDDAIENARREIVAENDTIQLVKIDRSTYMLIWLAL